MKTEYYLGSASTLSLGIVSILFVSIGLTTDDLVRIENIGRARLAYAAWSTARAEESFEIEDCRTIMSPLTWLVPARVMSVNAALVSASLLPSYAGFANPLNAPRCWWAPLSPALGKWSGAINNRRETGVDGPIDTRVVSTGRSLEYDVYALDPFIQKAWHTRLSVARIDTGIVRGAVEIYDPRKSFRWTPGPSGLVPQKTSEYISPEHLLESVEADVLSDPPKFREFERRFMAVHSALASRKVKVPLVDQEVRVDYALLLLQALTLCLLAVIRNKVRYVWRDPNLAEGESWLMVDRGHGIERILGGTWLCLLLASPWLIGAAVFATSADRILVDGLDTSFWVDIPVFLGVTAMMVSGGWVSLTLTATLVALRVRRAEQLQKALREASDLVGDTAAPLRESRSA
jgi:hypothetical protein